MTSRPDNPMECQWCKKDLHALAKTGGYLARTNPKGVPGKWQCVPPCRLTRNCTTTVK